MQHLAGEFEWGGDPAQGGRADLVDDSAVDVVHWKGDGELVAIQPRNDRVRRGDPTQGRADRAQQVVAGFIAVAVVDRLEPMQLQRNNRQLVAIGFEGRSHRLPGVGKALAIREVGDAVGRRKVGRAPFRIAAPLRFMLEISAATQTPDDQRHVENDDDQRNFGAKLARDFGIGKERQCVGDENECGDHQQNGDQQLRIGPGRCIGASRVARR